MIELQAPPPKRKSSLTIIVYPRPMVTVPYSELQLRARNNALGDLGQFLVISIFILVVVFASGAGVGILFPDLFSSTDELAAESPMARFVWYPVYLLVLMLSLPKLMEIVRLATFSPLIILCVLFCGLSMFWSIDPPTTLRRSIALLLTSYIGLTLAAWFSWGRLVQIIAIAFLLIGLITIALVVIDPGRAIMQEVNAGAWRGPFAEKNQLGGMMTKGLIAAICAFALRPKRAWLYLPIALLCFGLVIASTSKTALLISMLCIGTYIFLKLYRTNPVTRIPLIFTLVMSIGFLSVALAMFPEVMFGLIGKDPSLTGRTDIWALLSEAIRKKFWLGYGYGIFWDDPLGPSYIVRQVLEWGVPTAHNGWIEIWLSAGIGIVILFALQILATLGFAVYNIRNGGRETYWVVLMLLSYIGFSMSESAILQQNSLSWILFVATCAKLFTLQHDFRPLRDEAKAAN